ncbi:MAG: cyclase family protein [Polyangiaceae bacterium]
MGRRIIDLTHPIHEGMTTFPVHWHPVVEISILGRHGIEARETRKLVLGTHTGTHCDAPRHFVPGGATIDQVAPETLVGDAYVCDFSSATPMQAIDAADLSRQLPEGAVERVILRYDWSRHWGHLRFYADHPFLTEGAARLLLDRGVKLVAMDTPMPDSPKDGRGTPNDSPIHKILLGAGAVLVEYLTNLAELRRRRVELIVAPLKIEGGDGAPARCFAIESDS